MRVKVPGAFSCGDSRSDTGMAVGDEFLLSSSRDLHNVVLNGDGINHLGLGRITRVNNFSSVVEVVAGEKVPASDYVAALPF